MKTLISILGPTAVGKTSFALKIAEQALKLRISSGRKLFTGIDLISADSRQVYKGLEILSGADIPKGFKSCFAKNELKLANKFSFFKKDLIHLHGVSILDLTDKWSVACFRNFAIKIIKRSFENNRLPIIVGGTNLYINQLFNCDDDLYVSPIKEVRNKAKLMSVEELQTWLKNVNPKKICMMNNSDINNPRRLIRAIEISIGKPNIKQNLNLPDDINNLKFSLSSDLDTIFKKINQRVVTRFDNGAVDEVKNLNKICKKSVIMPMSCTTLGVSDISSYLENEISQKKCLENWALHEFQYAKRQLVWLRKESNVIWLDDLSKSSYTLDSNFFRNSVF